VRDLQNFGALGERQTTEVPKLDELGEFGMADRQFCI
jgi:hypothetical protein